MPLPAIIHHTHNDWKFIKGQVDYVDLSNEWILLRFANSQDKTLVYDQRPWYLNGLNFILLPWGPFFDPYDIVITRVDQWVRIPRLPLEFWEAEYPRDLVKHVGEVIKIDQSTLLRLNGKFIRVCVNIDITRPLPDSINVSRVGG